MQLETKPICFINELVFYLTKGKGNAFAVHATKAFGGSRGIAPLILNLHTK
jgi:hypothetical protein